ncbi:MAG: hypothetical protein IRZ17_00235 [Mycolicibacterium hassiacum]|uniref:hypothetical protein n=1 Tax=Mycolicibacterium hassiacum TaxID=46351 RepID=UPI0023F6D637|nr:hypothetical protein [Mycolicibacterium hassiacum]MBX5485022.1 hypothetical protein [Mycolicibacterium hassiacum]
MADDADDRSTGTARIIRRHPTGEIPVAADPPTSIIRRHPSGEFAGSESATGYLPRSQPAVPGPNPGGGNPEPSPRPAIAVAVFAILSGWATAVIATNLIIGWWRTDRLFCVAVGFLTAITAAALIAGLIGLLLRRRVSRLLIVVGAVVALLIFSSLFVAGARLPAVVYAIPVLPVVTVLLALLPATASWARSG